MNRRRNSRSFYFTLRNETSVAEQTLFEEEPPAAPKKCLSNFAYFQALQRSCKTLKPAAFTEII